VLRPQRDALFAEDILWLGYVVGIPPICIVTTYNIRTQWSRGVFHLTACGRVVDDNETKEHGRQLSERVHNAICQFRDFIYIIIYIYTSKTHCQTAYIIYLYLFHDELSHRRRWSAERREPVRWGPPDQDRWQTIL